MHSPAYTHLSQDEKKRHVKLYYLLDVPDSSMGKNVSGLEMLCS